MTDQGPANGQPSAPLAPLPQPAPRPRRHPVLTALMIIAGIIALLPGVCALFFMAAMPGGGNGVIALLWLLCLAISAGGIVLLVLAFRR
jgi:hypothetical protein